MVARFRRELEGDAERDAGPQMKVIATGGLAERVARETPVIQHVDPWLTLDGLRIIYEMNR
jgi:type III pantothenate kinase